MSAENPQFNDEMLVRAVNLKTQIENTIFKGAVFDFQDGQNKPTRQERILFPSRSKEPYTDLMEVYDDMGANPHVDRQLRISILRPEPQYEPDVWLLTIHESESQPDSQDAYQGALAIVNLNDGNVILLDDEKIVEDKDSTRDYVSTLFDLAESRLRVKNFPLIAQCRKNGAMYVRKVRRLTQDHTLGQPSSEEDNQVDLEVFRRYVDSLTGMNLLPDPDKPQE